jgi:hypothetical protein
MEEKLKIKAMTALEWFNDTSEHSNSTNNYEAIFAYIKYLEEKAWMYDELCK